MISETKKAKEMMMVAISRCLVVILNVIFAESANPTRIAEVERTMVV